MSLSIYRNLSVSFFISSILLSFNHFVEWIKYTALFIPFVQLSTFTSTFNNLKNYIMFSYNRHSKNTYNNFYPFTLICYIITDIYNLAKEIVIQYINDTFSFGNRLNLVKKNIYDLTFSYNDKEYKILFPIKGFYKHKINMISTQTIINGENENESIGLKDITESILQYMGPNENFYTIPTTPNMLGYDNISIEYEKTNDDLTKSVILKTFKKDEMIFI